MRSKKAEASGGLPAPARQRWVPTRYMKRAVRFLLERGGAGLLLDPGLRKTSITLYSIRTLQRELRTGPWLVVAPLRACHLVWPAEARKWDVFEGMRVEVLHGKDREAALDREADVYCVNPEGMPWLVEALSRRQGRRSGFKFFGLVLDESTMYKRATTERFKLLRPLLPLFKRRWILTGTVSPNGLLDFYGQAYVVDLGSSLGRFYTQYRQEYFYPTGYGGYTWLPQPGADEKIFERLAPLMLRISEEELDLPPCVGRADSDAPGRVTVRLDRRSRKAYDEMEDLLMTQIRDGLVTAKNVAVATGKCGQIANGGLYVDGADGSARTWQKIHDLKTDAVEEYLDELHGAPLLVGVDFHHDAERLRKRLGKTTEYMGKGVSVKDAQRIERAWNDGDLRVLLMSVHTPHALNMQKRCRHVLLHSLIWNWEYYDQFVRRVFRSGVSGKVLVSHVVAEDTVDEAKMSALASKGSDQRAAYAALVRYAKRR